MPGRHSTSVVRFPAHLDGYTSLAQNLDEAVGAAPVNPELVCQLGDRPPTPPEDQHCSQRTGEERAAAAAASSARAPAAGSTRGLRGG